MRPVSVRQRSEEHTSELQSRVDLVCRLLLEKKKLTVRIRVVASIWKIFPRREGMSATTRRTWKRFARFITIPYSSKRTWRMCAQPCRKFRRRVEPEHI